MSSANPLVQFILDLEAEGKKLEAEIVQFAQDFIPKVEHLLEVALGDIIHIALQAVLTEAPKLIAGSEKFGNAVGNVIMTVEAQGKTILLQTAQTGVQAAYLTAVAIAKAAQPPAQ